MPNTLLCAGDIDVTKTDQVPSLIELTFGEKTGRHQGCEKKCSRVGDYIVMVVRGSLSTGPEEREGANALR